MFVLVGTSISAGALWEGGAFEPYTTFDVSTRHSRRFEGDLLQKCHGLKAAQNAELTGFFVDCADQACGAGDTCRRQCCLPIGKVADFGRFGPWRLPICRKPQQIGSFG
jgi:hypothetical protein